MRGRGPALLLLILGIVLAAWAGATRAANEPVSLNWNLGTKGLSYADIYVAMDKGFFKEEQIEVALTASSTSPAKLLLAGGAHFSSGQPTFTYVPNSQGADIVAIYSPAATYEVWVAKAGITSPRQLEGKTIGVFSLQDLDVVYTRQMMEQFGLKTGAYTLLAVGPTNSKVAALTAGHVDAAPLYPPAQFVAQQQGLVQIFNTAQLKAGQVPTFYLVRRSWAEQNKATVVRVIRGLNRAHDWLFNPANKAEAIQILAKHTSVAPELVTQIYDLYFTKPGVIYSKNGEWDANVVRATGNELVTLGLLTGTPPKYESTVAPEYREQALKGSPGTGSRP